MSNTLITKLAEFVTVLRLEEPALANAIQVLLDARQKEIQQDPWCPGPYKVGFDSKNPAHFQVIGPNGPPTKDQCEPTSKLIAISDDLANAVQASWEATWEHGYDEAGALVYRLDETGLEALRDAVAKLDRIRQGEKLR